MARCLATAGQSFVLDRFFRSNRLGRFAKGIAFSLNRCPISWGLTQLDEPLNW